MSSVLLVFSQQDAAVEEQIRRAFARADMQVDRETTLKPLARRVHEKTYSFVVGGISLAKDEESPVLEDGGLALCAEVRRRSNVEIALIGPRIHNSVRLRAAKIAPPAPLLLSTEDGLGEALVEQLRHFRARPRRLEIIIIAAEKDNWSYEMHGKGFEFLRSNVLNTNPQLVEAQMLLSEGILRAESWHEQFAKLGKNIVRDLVGNTPQFKADLDQGLKEAGGVENTRLTFSVARCHYQIMLEAIFRPDDLPEPWMVHAPLVRNIRGVAPAHGSLFDGAPEPLRCLVICADTSGDTKTITTQHGDVTILDPLEKVQTEARNVRRMLEAQRDHVGEVVSLGGPDDKSGQPLTRERLLDVLGKGWDLVHYAGHSKFDHKDGKEVGGYLFVGERESPEPIEISKVAPYLRRSKLLYLSSCESANAPFAVEAANNLIPAVIGFRWRLPDTEAAEYADLFYQALFERQAIDTAFWSVRKALYKKSPQSKTWASSVLMMR